MPQPLPSQSPSSGSVTSRSLAAAKQALRSEIRQIRRQLDATAAIIAGDAVAAHLLELPETAQAHVVMVYGAAPDELDPRGCEQPFRDRGARVAYPRVEGDEIVVVEVTPASALTTGFGGIREPLGPPMDPESVDVVVVPGLAFDRTGRRLGHGKAYYDRLLPRMRATRIGVAFDEQIVEAVPADDHDQPMDMIVTPTQLIRCL